MEPSPLSKSCGSGLIMGTGLTGNNASLTLFTVWKGFLPVFLLHLFVIAAFIAIIMIIILVVIMIFLATTVVVVESFRF